MARPPVTRIPDFRDLDLDFIPHPVTGDISKKVGAEAIKRSVRNLVLTNFYDRPFQSYIGGNVQRMLFEPVNPLTAQFLKTAIEEVIRNFEPRAYVIDISLRMDIDGNGYDASITFKVQNLMEPILTTLFLRRIR